MDGLPLILAFRRRSRDGWYLEGAVESGVAEAGEEDALALSLFLKDSGAMMTDSYREILPLMCM